MHALFIFVVLAFSVGVVVKALDHLITLDFGPFASLKPLGVAMLVAWGLNYSVFTAFGVHVRFPWENPVMTGVALMAGAAMVDKLLEHMPFSHVHKD